MLIRWPLTFGVDGLRYSPEWGKNLLNPGWQVVYRDVDRDISYLAPRWIAWLYRRLPHHLGWHGGSEFDAQRPAYFLWSIQATRWMLAWLPSRRCTAYRAAGMLDAHSLGILALNDRRVVI